MLTALRLPITFTVTFTTGIISGYLFAASNSQQTVYDDDEILSSEFVDYKLSELIHKHSTNISISNADSNEAKQLALIIGKYAFLHILIYDFTLHIVNCSMNYMRSIPNWVAEFITLNDLQTVGDKKPKRGSCYEDLLTPKTFRANNDDYKKSGFDRGHLAPAADHVDSAQHIRSTMSLSNIVPQNSSMNKGIWSSLEGYVRNLIKSKEYDSCIVITGPVFKPEIMSNSSNATLFINDFIGAGDHMVHVPTHLFKVILAQKRLNDKIQYDLYSFMIKNAELKPHTKPKEIDLEEHMIDTSYIEKLTGLQFFAQKNDAIRVVDRYTMKLNK